MTPERLTEVEQAARRLRTASPTGEDPVADHLEECIDEVRRLQAYNDQFYLQTARDEAEVERLKKLLACIEEGGEQYFPSLLDLVRHLQLLARRAHTPDCCPECGGRREILDDMGGTWACPACNLVKPQEPTTDDQ